VFFSEEILVDSPVERTAARLSTWLGAGEGDAAAAEATQAGRRVLARAGFAGVSKTVEVHTARHWLRDGVTVIPLRWTATGPLRDLFPPLAANLEISAADAGKSRVALIGSYRPPLGPVGELLDRTLLFRAGEVTLRNWLRAAGEAVRIPDEPQVSAPPLSPTTSEPRSPSEPRPRSGATSQDPRTKDDLESRAEPRAEAGTG
jgi:hypothetical protein